jgi:hypothetical protein
LRELAVSEIECLEHSAPMSSYEDNFGEIRDESQRIDDMISQLCELEDSDHWTRASLSLRFRLPRLKKIKSFGLPRHII